MFVSLCIGLASYQLSWNERDGTVWGEANITGLHYLWLELNQQPSEEGKFLIVDQLVLDRVESVILVALQTVGQFLVPFRIRLRFLVAQHRVPGDIHRVSGYMVAHETNAIRHVVVLAAPSPEEVGKS